MQTMEGIFNPKSIAVIGASTRAGSIGNQVMIGLLADKYQGKIYPINPTAPEVPSFFYVALCGSMFECLPARNFAYNFVYVGMRY